MTTGSATATTRSASVLPGFLLLAAIWGSSFLFIKVGLEALHPTYVALTRVTLGAITLLLVMLIMRERLPREPRLWAHLTVIGIVGVALPFTLFGYGEQRIPSLLAGIWNATTPLVALPVAALLFRTERFSARKVAGIGLGFAGVLVVLGVWQGVGGGALTGQLMCIAAAACYGLAIPYMKLYVAHRPISSLTVVTMQMLTATAALMLVAPLAAGPPPMPTTLPAKVIGSMLVLGAVGSGFAFVIHMRNIRLMGATAASQITYLSPLFAVLAGVLVLAEPLHWHQPVGALLVLAGVAISQGSLPRLRRAPKPPRLADHDTRPPAPVAADTPPP